MELVAKLNGKTLKVWTEDDAQNPRKEFDSFGHMVCWHSRYYLGDKHKFHTPTDFYETVKRKGIAVILPLWLYDHSGLYLKVGNFAGMLPQGHAEFDTMQVGYIYVTKDEVRKRFGVKRVTKRWLLAAEALLCAEVKTYDQYLNGDVYGFTLEDENGEEVDSCGGFYGTDWDKNGLLDSIGKEWAEPLKEVDWQ